MPKKRKAGNRGPGGAGRAAKRAMEPSRININTNAFRGALGVRGGAPSASMGGAGAQGADSKEAAMRGDFFDRVRRQRNKDEVYTMANVVLSAVTEVIEAGLVPLTPTAYFGALLKSLQSASGTSPSLTAASVFLLSLAVREVPAPVLRENMSAVRAALAGVVAASQASAASVNKSTLRHVVEVYAVLLGAQDSHAWKNSAMHKFLHEFLFFTIHEHPKVRRKAQQCVQQLFEGKLYPTPRDGSDAPAVAPAMTLNAIRHHSSGIVSKFCRVVFASSAVDDSNKALYVLGWLKHVIHMLSPKAMKVVGELLVGVLREREGVHLHILILDCFEGLFMTTVRTDDDNTAEAHPLKSAPKPLVLHMVTALLAMGVAADVDKDLVVAHTRATATGLVAAYELDATWTYTKLPGYIGTVVQLFRSEDNIVLITATDAIKVLVDKCVDNTMVQQAAQARRAEVQLHATPLEAIVEHVESALGLKYSASWGMVLVVVANMFEVLDSHAYPLCNSLLTTAVGLRSTHRFRFNEQLGAAIGAAVGAIGPERLLTVLPLQLDEVLAGTLPLSKSRAWLLPLLKRHVQGASLRFFATVLLPLATQVRQRFEALQRKELHEIEAANLRMIHKQLWWLLPAFCDGAGDIAEAFDMLAPAIGHRISGKQALANGQVIEYDPELRPVMVQALTHILVTARRHAEDKPNAIDVAACAKHAPQFLPIFFNTMGVTEGPTREALREALSQYALLLHGSPAPEHRALVNAFFKNVLKTLLVASTADDMPADGDAADSDEAAAAAAAAALAAQRARLASQHMLIDLAAALVESLEDDAKDMLYRVIEPQLSDDDMVFQKKSYRVLERLLATSSTFVRDHFDAVLEMLLRVAPDCSISARRARLRCLQSLVAAIEVDKLASVPELLAEVITSVRESNPRSRAIAYDVLLTLSGKFSPTSHSPALTGGMETDLGEFFLMCMAGLAGTPHMITATVHALSRLVYQYRAEVGDIQVQLLDSVLLFFEHKSREIIKAVFGFVKVCIVTLDPETLGPFLPRIMEGLFTWTEDARNRFRFRAKVVLERLIRKIGYEAVYDLVPPQHRRFLTNLRKTKEREARKKAELRAGGGKRTKAGEDKAAAAAHQEFEDAMYGGDLTGVDTFRDGGDDGAGDDDDDMAFTERGEHAPDERWIKEGGSDMDDDVLDLLDGSAAGQAVLTAEERARAAKRRKREKKRAAAAAAEDGDGMAVRADGFGLSREGKIVVPDDEEEEHVEEQLNTVRSHMRWLARMQKEGYGAQAARAVDDGVDSDDEGDGEGDKRGKGSRAVAEARKASRKRKGEMSRGAQLIEQYEGGGNKKQRHDPGQFYGRQFKPKRGTGGDVRRKGQEQEPHAYMPLHPQQLSRRFQKKGMKRFDKLVHTSKRGQTLTKTQRRAKRAKGGRR